MLYISNKDRKVDLALRAKDAVEMMVSNDPSFYGAAWQPFADSIADWTLTKESDGKHWVYARFRDAVGNVSKATAGAVVLDTHDPVLLAVSFGPDTVTRHRTRALRIDGHGSDFMRVGTQPDLADAEAFRFSNALEWPLDGDDGPKTVYVQLLDSAQNRSEIRSASIRLDTAPPEALDIILEEGKNRTRSTQTSVALRALNATMMQFSTSPGFEDARWVGYSETPFMAPLGTDKGLRLVYARFKDEAGNISETLRDSLIVEIIPTLEGIDLDRDAPYCIHPDGQVLLRVRALHAAEMMVSNNERFLRAEWRPFQDTLYWKLEGEEGEKTVYVKVRSATETEAQEERSDAIVWDKSKPKDGAITIDRGAPSTFEHWVKVELKARDAHFMQLSPDSSFAGAGWKGYDPAPFEFALDKTPGTKTLFARFKDDKGNVSSPVSASILLEVQPVAGMVLIDKGAEFCTHPEGKITLEIKAMHAKEMMVGHSPDFPGGVWEPFSPVHTWNLEGTDGTKLVYIKFRSQTLTESATYTDYIELDRTPPTGGKVSISLTHAGEGISPHHLYVALQAEGAVAMQVGLHPNFHPKQPWLGYSDVGFLFDIGPRDGEITLYARFKDVAGNISEVVSQTVTVDRKRPEDPSIRIEGNPLAVNTENIVLELHAEGVSEMRLNTVPVFNDMPWEFFSDRKAWKLEGDDGTKRIYAQFRDATGNVSRTVGVRVELDRDKPTEQWMEVKDDFCTDRRRTVSVALRAYGASRVMLSNSPDFADGAWMRYRADMEWVLPDLDAEHTVYAKFSDEAGNETPVVSDRVVLDRYAPLGTVTINGGDAFTQSLDANLSIMVDDAEEMMISNRPDFAKATPWMPYAGIWSWQLADGPDGLKQVFVRFRDRAGNISMACSDSISLDRAGPLVRGFSINDNATAVKGPRVTLHSQVEGAHLMMVSNRADFSGASWEPFFPEKEWELAGDEGEQSVYVKYQDHLGNETIRAFTDKITVYKKLYYIGK
jgi:hypothetical protein